MPSDDESDESVIDRIIRQSRKIQHDGFGRMGRVFFDFRYPSFDLEKWSVSHIMVWALSDNGALLIRSGFPKIWYPWFGKFTERSFRKTIGEIYWSPIYKEYEYGKIDVELRSELALQEIIEQAIPKYFVSGGDTIKIHEVIDRSVDHELESEDDRIIKHVYLKIVKKDADEIKIETPFEIDGANTILSNKGSYHHTFDDVLHRICRFYKLRKFDELNTVIVDSYKNSRAAQVGYKLFKKIEPVMGINVDDSEAAEQARDLYRVVNDAVLLGFLWAKAEADLSIKPLALAALEAQKNSKEWGKKSGAKRREAAREGWMPVAAEMAKDLRKQDPHISQEDLAFEIRAVWKDEHLKAPGTARLKQYIGELENLELLDRRVPKPKKPKK